MRTVLFLSLVTFTAASAPCQVPSSDMQAKLNMRATQYSLSANGLADAVLRVAKRFELPVGIEWVKDKDTARGLSLSWKDDSVEAILRSVVQTFPGYELRVEQSEVHVFRRDLVDDGRNFLNLKVPDFFEVHQEGGGRANQQLEAIAQNIVSPRNFPPGAGEASEYATGIEEKPLTLTLGGLTFREALNKLVETSERKMWVVTFSDGPGLTPTGFRRTETLWHPAPFPNHNQPMWDLMAWEESLTEPGSAKPSH
ncbi:MAG: hypothetical protein WAO35_01235 [Terriglobia bacterium]